MCMKLRAAKDFYRDEFERNLDELPPDVEPREILADGAGRAVNVPLGGDTKREEVRRLMDSFVGKACRQDAGAGSPYSAWFIELVVREGMRDILEARLGI